MKKQKEPYVFVIEACSKTILEKQLQDTLKKIKELGLKPEVKYQAEQKIGKGWVYSVLVYGV